MAGVKRTLLASTTELILSVIGLLTLGRRCSPSLRHDPDASTAGVRQYDRQYETPSRLLALSSRYRYTSTAVKCKVGY